MYAKEASRRRHGVFLQSMSDWDFDGTQKISWSYTEIPEGHPNVACSNLDALGKSVINQKYISVPIGREDNIEMASKRKIEELTLFFIEDENFEIDVMLETTLATIVRLNEI